MRKRYFLQKSRLFYRHLEATIFLSPTCLTLLKVLNQILSLTIGRTLECPSESFDFHSYAQVVTSTKGCFDLLTQPSFGGTYTGNDQMGLF